MNAAQAQAQAQANQEHGNDEAEQLDAYSQVWRYWHSVARRNTTETRGKTSSKEARAQIIKDLAFNAATTASATYDQ